tara:strand:+ start:2393 stop:2929 length:537 start_codon:yes stop_codon:yes gene_type:complete
MKKVFFTIALLTIFSCGEHKTSNDQEAISELQKYKTLVSEEESTKKFIEDYLIAMNSSNWKSELSKYLSSDSEAFLKEHTIFRASFTNYNAVIKHLTVDGDKGIVWIKVTANYTKTYSFESKNDTYGDTILNGIKAENQVLSWDETWYFDVVDGKFGNEWDFLKDNYAVLKGLNALAK